MPSSGKSSQLLARVNFPLYTVHCLTERHVLVAGGGGGSKTGICNVIEIYELINNGSTCRAESVTRYETGSVAIMNCTIYNAGKYSILFAGMEGECQLYKIKYDVCDGVEETETASESPNDTSATLRKRSQKESIPADQNSNNSHENDNSLASPHVCFTIHPLDSFQTDFSEDPFQKLVRFSSIPKILATAGADGHIRVWKYPNLNKLYEIQAHSDDVDDMDICPLGKKIASVSRDGQGKIWSVENGKLISSLSYTLPSKCKGKYIFRSCRFGVVQENQSLPLFTTLNPAVVVKPQSPSFLCKWSTDSYAIEQISSVGTDMLSVMAISDDGIFLGLGTQSGSVKIHIAFSLQLLYNVDHAHRIFVTGLEFLHTSDESRRITGGHESSLISISVDNHINIHHVPVRGTMGMLTLITLFLLILLCIFVVMDYFNL